MVGGTSEAWTVYVAGYAAVVSTGALFLEVRRWFESGPRLRLKVMPEAQLISGGRKDPNEYLFVWVTNVGSASTTITHMVLHQYRNVFQRLRRRPYSSAFVPRPEPSGGIGIPMSLAPGAIWQGVAEYDQDLREMADSGHLYVGVACSHRSREFMKKVRIMPKSQGRTNQGS
jgi:hypothetical protein